MHARSLRDGGLLSGVASGRRWASAFPTATQPCLGPALRSTCPSAFLSHLPRSADTAIRPDTLRRFPAANAPISYRDRVSWHRQIPGCCWFRRPVHGAAAPSPRPPPTGRYGRTKAALRAGRRKGRDSPRMREFRGPRARTGEAVRIGPCGRLVAVQWPGKTAEPTRRTWMTTKNVAGAIVCVAAAAAMLLLVALVAST